MNRYTEEMKLWLFDLAHGNLDTKKEDIIKGFMKHYVMQNCVIGNVQDDIIFHTPYGSEGARKAMTALKAAIEDFIT